MNKETMKLALEVLQENHHLIEEYEHPDYLAHYDRVIGEVAKALAKQEQKRPQNCGTSYCSCIECVMDEQEQGEPAFYAHDGYLMTPERAKFLGFPLDSILALYTTPPHSFFEDVADDLRVEIAELQDHVRLLEKQLAQQKQGEPDDEEVLGFNGWGFPIEPPSKQEQGEFVAIVEELPTGEGNPPFKFADLRNVPTGAKLYTTPQQRTWVGLTDEEIEKMRHLIDWTAHWSYGIFAKAIEAKLKEKNT